MIAKKKCKEELQQQKKDRKVCLFELLKEILNNLNGHVHWEVLNCRNCCLYKIPITLALCQVTAASVLHICICGVTFTSLHMMQFC